MSVKCRQGVVNGLGAVTGRGGVVLVLIWPCGQLSVRATLTVTGGPK